MTIDHTRQHSASGLGLRGRMHVLLAAFGPSPKAPATALEPLWTGDSARARKLGAGAIRLGGVTVTAAPGASPWDIVPPTAAWEDALHSFEWLDDFAATSDSATRTRLSGWLFEWIDRFGAGAGPGWRPELTGRRLTRWCAHAAAVLEDAPPAGARALLRSIGRQTRYLQRQWRRAPPGLARFQAASGLVHAGFVSDGRPGAALGIGAAALGREAERRIGADGGVASRNPEQLAEIFAVLVWAARRIEDSGGAPDPAHAAALSRLAAAIRALRLGDGALARFHGGGGGDQETIDRALTASGLKHGAPVYETMGFHRIASSRTIAIFDAGEETSRRSSAPAHSRHASLFCFEASIGRRPFVVNCGPGAPFGEAWRRAAKASAAHSGLSLDDDAKGGDAAATAAPGHVSALREENETGVWLIAEHDGWLRSHGVVHQRRIWLSADGGDIRGEDRLSAAGPAAHAVFDTAAGRDGGTGVPFTIRFHLHPDVEAEMFLAGSAVRLRPGTGDVWVMRQSGGHIAIEESVYLDEAREKPRATKQIVVRGRAAEYRGEVRWTFRRAERDRPEATGDAARADA